MTSKSVRSRALRWALPACVLAGAVACSASDNGPVDSGAQAKGSNGSACATNANCTSNLCSAGQCVGNGMLSPPGDPCTTPSTCASGVCTNGQCGSGQNLPPGYSCSKNGECASGVCANGSCTSGNSSSQGGTSNTGITGAANPPYEGLGPNWNPLTPGCGPETSGQCGGTCEATRDPNGKVIRPPATFCFGASPTGGIADPTPDDPAAMIEQVIETQNGVSYVHIRVTFDPAFVDNTYGANASAGWYASANGKTGKGHTFSTDLTNSDHIELKLTDASGNTIMEIGEDYIHSLTDTGGGKPPKNGAGGAASAGTGGATSSVKSACGYANLGVLGGDGKMITGNASDVIATASSIDRNLNGCGYCQSSACSAPAGTAGATGAGDCTVNSPLTDENYTPNPATPNWNYAVVYEVWIKLDAFTAGGGFGQAYVTFVHASPSKIPGNNTLYVEPTPCPPNWTSCPPGQTCPPSGGGGAGGGGGVAGAGNVPECPPNYQLSITLEDNRVCEPIPYAGWPNMAACPQGYKFAVDITDESQHCVASQ
jgi:hypothetical protein